jgi:nucleotide-binding universal stress UspA family protein
MTDQMTVERPAAGAATQTMLKSILLHVQDDASLNARLESALSLARSAGAHLSCMHVTPLQAYVAFDTFGGVFVMKDVMEALDKQETTLREKLQEKLGSEDVSWDYEQITGDIAAQVINSAALADILVVGRDPHRQDFAGPAIAMMGELLLRASTPLLVPGDEQAAFDANGDALIAWDGSYEAANAVRASLGLLSLASEVVVVNVAEEKPNAFPGTRLLEYLSRHGIHADLAVQDPPGSTRDPEVVASTLVSYARGIKAAYMVMGGYSHGRAREIAFGGVTRSLLKECPIPLVIAH